MSAVYEHIARDQRHTRGNPCPVCGGGDGDRRGRGMRCWGFTSADEQWAVCTNDDYAGTLEKNPRTGGYRHKLCGGPCHCGETHSGEAIHRAPSRPETPPAARPPSRAHRRHAPIAAHVYYNADGTPRFRVVRLWSGERPAGLEGAPKCLPQRPDGAGDWIDGLDGMPYGVLYRQADVITADPWEPVFIPEGEKCADALAAVGAVATCNAGGAGKWYDEYSGTLRGRQAVILADADAPGQEHAAKVAASLAGIAATVRIVTLEGAHDVADWLANGGHTYTELRAIAAASPLLLLGSRDAGNDAQRVHLDSPEQTQKTCPNCRPLLLRAEIAEKSLERLRERHALNMRILAMPKEQLSPKLKPAALVVREILSEPRARDEAGMEPVYRAAIAQRTGVSEQTAGGMLRELAEAGIIKRDVIKTFDRSEIRIAEGPLWTEPEKIQPNGKTWGGRRVKTCAACGSDDLETRVICRQCGTVQSAIDTNAPAPPPEPGPGNDAQRVHLDSPASDSPDALGEMMQEQPQNTSLPDISIVTKLALYGADRGQLLELAYRAGWRAVRLSPAVTVGGDMERWQRFCHGGDADAIRRALEALATHASVEAS